MLFCDSECLSITALQLVAVKVLAAAQNCRNYGRNFTFTIFRMPFGFVSMMIRPRSIINAPAYALGSSISPANKNATMPANTGSSVNMTPT